ncbi:MAG: hypothetical protein JXA95_17865 [Spirochaetales bacterium]|nr:hypothetical protein [Spirochaetales bacterium]
MSRLSDEEKREKFWTDMSEQVGEEIEKNALLRVLESEPENLKDQWILFFGSSKTLYYKRFPNDSAMARLFNVNQDVKEYPVEGLSWDNVVCEKRGAKGFLGRLLKTPDVLDLRWGDEMRFKLELDKRGEALFGDRLAQA